MCGVDCAPVSIKKGFSGRRRAAVFKNMGQMASAIGRERNMASKQM